MALNREAIRKHLKEYLESQGYPNISNETIMQKHLVPMFKILLSKGLVTRDMFPVYQEAAIQQYMIAKHFERF